MINRRQFSLGVACTALKWPLSLVAAGDSRAYKALSRDRLSLSQWSFHRAILGNSKHNYQQFIRTLHSQPDEVLKGNLEPRGIVDIARILNINTVDLVNILFFGHAHDKPWLRDFKSKANDNGVDFQVLMCDELGALGASDPAVREQAIAAHIPWLECAAFLGCRQLRVNATGDGSYLQQLYQCAGSMGKLADFAQQLGIELLVENHGHASNNGAWLAMLIELTGHNNIGAFTDFDNFFMGGWGIVPERRYDRIQGVMDLAPFTRGVSVKAHDFDAQGIETTIDYTGLMAILKSEGFSGYYSVEYEGKRLTELEGTKATINNVLQSLKDIG